MEAKTKASGVFQDEVRTFKKMVSPNEKVFTCAFSLGLTGADAGKVSLSGRIKCSEMFFVSRREPHSTKLS